MKQIIKIGIRDENPHKKQAIKGLIQEIYEKYTKIKDFYELNIGDYNELKLFFEDVDLNNFDNLKKPAMTHTERPIILINNCFFKKRSNHIYILIHETGHVTYKYKFHNLRGLFREFNEFLANKFVLEIDRTLLGNEIQIKLLENSTAHIDLLIEATNIDDIFILVFQLISLNQLIPTDEINTRLNYVKSKFLEVNKLYIKKFDEILFKLKHTLNIEETFYKLESDIDDLETDIKNKILPID